MKKTAILVILSILVLALAGVARAEDAAAIYKTKCATCHGATGAADTGMGKTMKLRALGSADVQKQTDDELNTIITKGKAKMPAYGAKLTPADVTGLVKFIRTLK
jgi:cytochrome c6